MSHLELDGANQKVLDSNGNELLKFGETASAVNEWTASNAAAGSGPTLAATGSETNIPATVSGKGTGKVALGQATCSGVQLVADQPLLDSSGNELAKFSKAASAVNEITIGNAAAGSAPSITPTGGDTDINLSLGAKGAGAISHDAPVKTPITSVQDLSTGNTITLPTGGAAKRLSASGGAVTGIILTAGRYAGDTIILFNIEASNTITMAAAGTSNVADGTSCVIGALRAVMLIWDSVSSKWYRTG